MKKIILNEKKFLKLFNEAYDDTLFHHFKDLENTKFKVGDEEYDKSWCVYKGDVTFDTWLMHFTRNGKEILINGFKKAVPYDKLEYLSSTKDTWENQFTIPEYYVEDGYNYAYRITDYFAQSSVFDLDSSLDILGNDIIIFKAQGTLIYHKTDKTYQVIFKSPTAKNLTLISRIYDEGKDKYKWITSNGMYSNFFVNDVDEQYSELRKLLIKLKFV